MAEYENPAVMGSWRMPVTRRQALAGMGALGFVLATGSAGASLVEPSRLEVTRRRIPMLRAPEAPLRVVHMSDLHVADEASLALVGEAVALALRHDPDAVMLTGDYINTRWDAWVAYAAALRPLAERCPAFAVFGNHDGGAWASRHGRGYRDNRAVGAMLEQAGIRVLHNASARLSLRDRRVHAVGVGDLWSAEFDPAAAWKDVPARAGETVLVLSHNPDTVRALEPLPWNLVLSGHTHGGQIVLPGGYAPVVPVKDRRFVAGLVPFAGRWVHVNRGVGTLFGVRINCRPEVSVLDLVPAEA